MSTEKENYNVVVLHKCGERDPGSEASCEMFKGHGGYHSGNDLYRSLRIWPDLDGTRKFCGYRGCARAVDHDGEHVSIDTVFASK